MTPDTREDFLYDDIIDLENAQKEHRRLVAILERFTTVLSVRDLLADVVSIPAARDLLVRETLDIVPSGPLANKIEARSPEELVEMLIEGEEEEPGPARALAERGWLPAAAASESLLHARHGDGGGRPRHDRLDALSGALVRRADHEAALSPSSAAREQGHSLRRCGRATAQLHARGRRRASAARRHRDHRLQRALQPRCDRFSHVPAASRRRRSRTSSSS